MQWHNKAGKVTSNLKVKMYFTMPEFRATKVVTQNCHVNDLAKSNYDMILGIYILTLLGLNLKLSEYTIEAYYLPLRGLSAPVVDFGKYEFKNLNKLKTTPEEQFIISYAEEMYKIGKSMYF